MERPLILSAHRVLVLQRNVSHIRKIPKGKNLVEKNLGPGLKRNPPKTIKKEQHVWAMPGKRGWRILVCVCVPARGRNKHEENRNMKFIYWSFWRNYSTKAMWLAHASLCVAKSFRSCLESQQKTANANANGILCTTLWVRLWGGYGMNDVAQHSRWDCGVAVGDLAQHSGWDCEVAMAWMMLHNNRGGGVRWLCSLFTWWTVVQIGQKARPQIQTRTPNQRNQK